MSSSGSSSGGDGPRVRFGGGLTAEEREGADNECVMRLILLIRVGGYLRLRMQSKHPPVTGDDIHPFLSLVTIARRGCRGRSRRRRWPPRTPAWTCCGDAVGAALVERGA